MAPLPKRRHSTQRQGKRRRKIKIKLTSLYSCPNCGSFSWELDKGGEERCRVEEKDTTEKREVAGLNQKRGGVYCAEG